MITFPNKWPLGKKKINKRNEKKRIKKNNLFKKLLSSKSMYCVCHYIETEFGLKTPKNSSKLLFILMR